MTKAEFRRLFVTAVERAAANVEKAVERPVPRVFIIDLHAENHPGSLMTIEQATDVLYMGTEAFFKIIDVGVTAVLDGRTHVFVRPSGHAPEDFAHTWNPTDLGPFKQIISNTNRFDSEEFRVY